MAYQAVQRGLDENVDVVVVDTAGRLHTKTGLMDELGKIKRVIEKLAPVTEVLLLIDATTGQTGPMRERPAYDQIVQGLSGMSAVTGTPETAPLRVGFPVCDTLGGMTAAMAIKSPLPLRRAATQAKASTSMCRCREFADRAGLGGLLITSSPARQPTANGNENPTGAPSATFQTGAGALNIAANKQEQFEILCKLIGREDLIDDPRFALRDDRKNRRTGTAGPRSRTRWPPRPPANGSRLLQPGPEFRPGLVLDVTESLDSRSILLSVNLW